MSLSSLCRTCGKRVNRSNAINIFAKKNDKIWINIQELTGLLLTDELNMPKNICKHCLLDLEQAIEFRNRCLDIHKDLLRRWEINDLDHSEQDKESDDDPLAAESDATFKDEEEEIISESEALSEVASYEYYQVSSPNKIKAKQQSPELESQYVRRRRVFPSQVTMKTSICEQCGSQFDDEMALSLHTQQHLDEEMDVYKEDTDEYKDEVDQYKDDVEEFKDEIDEYNDDEESTKSYIDSEQSLPVNQSTISIPKLAIPLNQTMSNHRSPKKTWKSSNLFCDQCGRHFNDKANLNRHLQRHLGIKNFECEECGHKDYSQHLINLHIRIQHRGEKPYACKFCGERFANSMTRLRHERNHVEFIKSNSDLTVFACNRCAKTFKRKSILVAHSVVHTGEQPFGCDTCKVHFNRKSSLRAHYRSKFHHNNALQNLDKAGIEIG